MAVESTPEAEKPEAPKPKAHTQRRRPGRSSAPLNPSTVAGLATAVLAVTGAFWFGLLSYGATLAYDPVGVRPREIGLSSGTVLAQSAAGFAFFVVLTCVLSLVVYGVLVILFHRTGEFGSWSLTSPRVLRIAAAAALILSVATAIQGVVVEAVAVGNALEDGRTESPAWVAKLGASPWSAEVAELAWAGEKPAGAHALPRCALYLGEADGTAVFYDAADERTWRLSSALLIVTSRPERDEC